MVDAAQEMLHDFCVLLYGQTRYTHNSHLLTHLTLMGSAVGVRL